MECIIAYLLLALFVDLIVELVRLDDGEEEAVWIKRRLWTNAPFDCGTRVVAGARVRPMTFLPSGRNRHRIEPPTPSIGASHSRLPQDWIADPEPGMC